jgi:hypothetical protein
MLFVIESSPKNNILKFLHVHNCPLSRFLYGGLPAKNAALFFGMTLAILNTGINCDFRSLRLCHHVIHVVVIQPTIKKSSLCGGAKYKPDTKKEKW